MSKLVPLLLVLLAFGLGPAAGLSAGRDSTPVELFGVVGADGGNTITLSNADGTRVEHLDPGTYLIHVDDQASIHDFHLAGPGVDKATAVEFVGKVDWTVTFTDGRYRVVCDPHSYDMFQRFTVGNPPPVKVKPAILVARAKPGHGVTLTHGGRALAVLGAGPVTVVVHDTSRADDFHLRGPGVDRKTGLGSTGTPTWTLTLRPGTYHFGSDASGKLRRSFEVV